MQELSLENEGRLQLGTLLCFLDAEHTNRLDQGALGGLYVE